MNEEMNYDEEFEETNVVETEEKSDNTDIEPENKSEAGSIETALLIGGIAVAGYLVGTGIKFVGKKAIGGVSGFLAKRKVKPDEDGCVAEAESEDIDEETEENSEQEEETVQKNSKRRK